MSPQQGESPGEKPCWPPPRSEPFPHVPARTGPRSHRRLLSNRANRDALLALATTGLITTNTGAAQPGKKPNIVVIWGDDIGVHNISAYNHGIMGYRTPNIDRIAKEGAMFTDFYAQQSCTAGPRVVHPRAASLPDGLADDRHARLARTAFPTGRRPSPTSSRSRVTRPASSARTTSATRTSTCPRCTGSTSSSATSTT